MQVDRYPPAVYDIKSPAHKPRDANPPNYLSIEVRTPGEVIKESEPPRNSRKGNLTKLKPSVREEHDRENPGT